MAKKQTKKVEEPVIVVPVKKTRAKVVKPKVEPQPATPPAVKKDVAKSKIKVKKEEVKVKEEVDLVTEIKVYQAIEANLRFDNEVLTKKLKEKEELLNSSLTQLETKQKQLDKLNNALSVSQTAIFNLKEDYKVMIGKVESLNAEVTKYSGYFNGALAKINQIENKVKDIISFIKYYKQELSTKYGPTPVNIIFSLIMFVIFGISILTAFGFKHVIGDTSNVSVVSVLSVCSAAIGYFLYLVNWKK